MHSVKAAACLECVLASRQGPRFAERFAPAVLALLAATKDRPIAVKDIPWPEQDGEGEESQRVGGTAARAPDMGRRPGIALGP
jgi:hypothetical protein